MLQTSDFKVSYNFKFREYNGSSSIIIIDTIEPEEHEDISRVYRFMLLWKISPEICLINYCSHDNAILLSPFF